MSRKEDIIRGHELRKYHQPDTDIHPLDAGVDAPKDGDASETASALHIVSLTSSPDTALTAYAQLAAWRLDFTDAKRSMVSLIGRTTQYIIAEATKSLDLEINSKHDEGDGLWLGCYVLPKENGLCESTVGLEPLETSFIVPDLLMDDRFKERPYVVGPPHLRFYAGTPLKSKLGINIGSLCIVDGKPRDGLSPDQMAFLQTMAGNIMAHLELTRESSLRKRESRMSQALTLFLEGKSFINQQPASKELESEAKLRKGSVTLPENTSSPQETPVSAAAAAALSPTPPPPHNPRRTTLDSLPGEGDPYILVFRRAANLLQQSLEVEEALFLDTTAGFSTHDEDPTPSNVEKQPFSGEESPCPLSFASTPIGQYQYNSGKMADILGVSSRFSSSLTHSTPKCSSVPERLLQKLLKRYPSGKIWTYRPDQPSADNTIEDFEGGPTDDRNEPLSPEQRAREDEQLLKAFPRARQILFVPLLDPTVSQRWLAGFFAWSTREYPALSRDTDLSFTRAFANNIIAEISRISIAAADEQKNSFISSISHELRSPLHGILGSNELLSESPLDTFQRDLVESIHSCGSTLLETLTSVLSYSKINSFKKSRKKRPATQNSKDGTGDVVDTGHEIEMYTNSNIAVLCEEVVEMLGGSWHVFNAGHTGADYDPMYRRNSLKPNYDASLLASSEDHKSEVIESPTLVLEIQYHPNWNFSTQPGALRRILMNIVSNSLKYTSAGFVKVMLQLEDGSEDKPYVVFTVQDTGKGISPAFLKKRLFLPFAQENAISSVGMGLGLSIVKGLVDILDGHIEVRSQLGRGTETKVSIPMNRIDVPDNKDKHSLETDVLTLRRNPLKIQFFGFDALVTNCFTGYFINWLEYTIVDPSREANVVPDIIVVNELEIPRFLAAASSTQVPALLAICMAGSRPGALPKEIRVIERVPQPFGMTKLCKALLGCIEKMRAAAAPKIVPTTEQAVLTSSPQLLSAAASSSVTLPTETEIPERISPLKLDPAVNGTQQNGEADKCPSPKSVISSQVRTLVRPPTEMLQVPSILLVDDNAINRKILQTFLKKLRYGCVESAENGLIAVNKVKNRPSGFQVIFMDLSMPVMDGLSATRAIRALEESRISIQGADQAPRPALIIALTGLASDNDQSEAFASGVDLFVTKPVKFAEIGDLLLAWKAREEG